MNNIEITEGELGSFTKEYLLDLPVPSVVGFRGSLGAGKTTIIKNIIRNLGIKEMVTSPTSVSYTHLTLPTIYSV